MLAAIASPWFSNGLERDRLSSARREPQRLVRRSGLLDAGVRPRPGPVEGGVGHRDIVDGAQQRPGRIRRAVAQGEVGALAPRCSARHDCAGRGWEARESVRGNAWKRIGPAMCRRTGSCVAGPVREGRRGHGEPWAERAVASAQCFSQPPGRQRRNPGSPSYLQMQFMPGVGGGGGPQWGEPSSSSTHSA